MNHIHEPVNHDEGLISRRLGIDTLQEPIVYMHKDCAVCRSEGFNAMSRIAVYNGRHHTLATLNVIQGDLLKAGEIGFSEAAWRRVNVPEGATVYVEHADPVDSFAHVRGKLFGRRWTSRQLDEIIEDVVAGKYTDVQISAFVAAGSDDNLDFEETVALTEAMLKAGDRLIWPHAVVVDKHCVGGLPGNRTTPIVVAIASEAGLTMPKTSSRAITSPAGTADTMETMTRVSLSLEEMRAVVDREGGCIVWGGAVRLSPADDLLIRVERALDIDSEPQLIASVLSKKAAAGSTHVVVDIPVGPTAKIRTPEEAGSLCRRLIDVGDRIGLKVRPLITDGTQPVGRGIGPCLEARDVLAVLRNEPGAPADLRERSLALAAEILDLGGATRQGEGAPMAAQILDSGRALKKFMAICEAQGGFREPVLAEHRREVLAPHSGRVGSIDNRRLARIAKLAGAPMDSAAGVDLLVRLDDPVEKNQPLFIVHAESRGELAYGLNYLKSGEPPVRVDPEP